MTPYAAFKKTLIDAWPNLTVFRCAEMVMLDYGYQTPILIGDYWINRISHKDANAFYASIKMPAASAYVSVSQYIADFYPRTSEALFCGNKSIAIRVFMKEKKTRNSFAYSGSLTKANREFKKAAGYKTIRARSLSKKHDWNTVK